MSLTTVITGKNNHRRLLKVSVFNCLEQAGKIFIHVSHNPYKAVRCIGDVEISRVGTRHRSRCLKGPMRSGILETQEKRFCMILAYKINGMVGDQIGEVSFEFYRLSIFIQDMSIAFDKFAAIDIERLVVYVVGGTGSDTKETVKSVLERE